MDWLEVMMMVMTMVVPICRKQIKQGEGEGVDKYVRQRYGGT